MLDALARFISRYAKIILTVWVVAFLVIVPTAVKGFDSSDYSINGMGSESSEGQKILEEHFHSTGIENNPVLVLSYDTPEGRKQFHVDDGHDNVAKYVMDWFKSVGNGWTNKLESSGGIYVLDESYKESSGLVAIGFTYREGTTSDSIMDDTPNLRSAVNSAISDYLSYIGVPTKQFNSYVTGNSAILYDTRSETVDTLLMAVVVVLIIAIVLMGLFFGSALTSAVTAVNIIFSAAVTMFLMKLLSSAIAIHSTIWLTTLFLCVAMSFAFCILYISTYRKNLLEGVDKDHALAYTVTKTGRLFIVSGLCILAAGVVFSIYDSYLIRSAGLCLIIASLSVLLVTLTIPASIICVTKNELFWTRNSDGSYQSKIVEKYSPRVDGVFDKVSRFSDRFSSKGCIAIIVAISLIAVGSAAYVVAKDLNSDSYDLTESIITGESAEGLKDLNSHSMGGVFQPFTVVMKCNDSIGTVEERSVSEYIPFSYHVIIWSSAAESTYKETYALMDNLVESNGSENIYGATTYVMWDELVKMAEDKGHKTGAEILDFVYDYLFNTNIIAYQGLTEERNLLRFLSDDVIVYLCGPILDYAMNSWLSDLGTDKKDGKLTLDYVAINVFATSTCTSDKVIGISDRINSTVDSFMKDSKCMSKSWVTGVGISYSDMYKQYSGGYYVVAVIAALLILLVIYFAERDVIVPIAITVSSLVSMFISSAIVIVTSMFVNGDVSQSILMTAPVFAMTFCVWFGYLQIAMMRNCGSISEMKKSFNPVIIVTSVIIALASLLMLFSGVTYISETGFTVAVMVLIDAFVVRMLFSPAIWKVGIDHKLKYFERYSGE